jgi:hypothetical protein
MIQFDINLEYAIFKEAYADALNAVKQDLAKRKQLVKWVYERDNLSTEQIKKTNQEEEHIAVMVEYVVQSELLINSLVNLLVNRRHDQIDWHEEFLREQEKGLQFTEMMITKYQKLRSNEGKRN